MQLGELASLCLPQRRGKNTDHFEAAIADFERAATIFRAADVLGAAIISRTTDRAADAAEFVLSRSSGATAATIELAKKVLNVLPDATGSVESSRAEISRIRKSLRISGRNPLRWLDLAHTYTSIAQNEKAEAAVRRAIALAPDHRFVLRSAARFFLHRGDPERAHELVISAPSTPHDPWLLAAEVAIAGVRKRDPEFYRDSKKFLGGQDLPPSHISELASAIATLELNGGSNRRARKLFRLALEQPTDNTIAQARWATSIDSGISLEAKHYSNPLSTEARAWYFFYAGEWSAALANFWTWHFDQPFSRKPPGTGSFVAAEILGDHKAAVEMARSGLTANPTEPALLNNLAYSLIHLGNLEEAAECFSRLRGHSIPPEDLIPLLATYGLFAFRCGFVQRGREFYLQAIEKAKSSGLRVHAVLAEIHLAHEEHLAGDPVAEQRLNEALDDARSVDIAYVKAIVSRLTFAVQQSQIDIPLGAPTQLEASRMDHILPPINRR